MFPTPLIQADGSVRVVVNSAPSGNSVFVGGFLYENDGHLHVNNSGALPALFSQGFGQIADGEMCVVLGGTIATYNQGIPMTADGRVVGQLGQVPLTTDPFVAGVRVGPAGGVYFNTI